MSAPRSDYLNRAVCFDCGHTSELHRPITADATQLVCAARRCSCRAFRLQAPKAELPPLTPEEIAAALAEPVRA